MHPAPGLLVVHGKVELILVLLRGLLAEPGEAVLLGVVVPGTEDIVLVLLEKAELCPVRELGALLVVAPVEGISEGGRNGGTEKGEGW